MRRDNWQATRTRLGQNSIRVSSNSTRNVNESSRATRNSTRKTHEKIYKILKVFFLNLISFTLEGVINNISL